jgi:general secretion pathway protein D
MKFRRLSIVFFFALTSSLLLGSSGIAENSNIPQPLSVTKKNSARLWNLQDADILSVINEVAQETGKNFAIDPRVTGKISLVSSKPIKQEEVYQVFLSVLELLGYSAIPSGNIIKIVPNMESGELASKIASKSSPGKGDEVVVRVIPLQNVTAAQLIPVLRPLLPQWSNISSYAPGNVLILLGRAANLKRIVDIIEDVDKASDSSIEVIPLQRASAQQVATVLTNLQNAARSAGETSSTSIATDDRSNSILLGGPKAARLRMHVLISQLDMPASSALGNTEVVYLRYLEAKILAPLLSKVAQNIAGKGSNTAADNSPNPSPPSTTSSSSNQTHIQAETSTNAVIITAPPALMQAIKSVIAKLDIRPAQVMVEAIIAEVDESNLRDLGIQWGGVADQSTSTMQSGTLPTSFPPLGAGVFGIIHGKHIGSVLSALENSNGVDILSTPSIVVLDNQKATIEIGQDVPVETGQYSTTGTTSTVTPFQTISMKPVTLKMDVTPQINLGNAVRLKIALKNDSLQNPVNPGLTPIINTSKITNAVIVNSEDILVVGGLISNTTNENVNKIPILGDIPIIGILFQQKSRSVAKKNLMVFIKPLIMHSAEEAMSISNQKYTMTRNIQASFREDLDEVGRVPLNTILPPWKNSAELPKPFETLNS